MQSSVFYGFQHTQIFRPIIAVYAVDVVNLFARLQPFYKRIGYKAVNQKTFAAFCAKTAVAEPHLNIRFGAPSVFFWR